MRRRERTDHLRALKLGTFHQGVGVDVAAVDELRLVRIERELELLARVEAAEREDDLRAAVDDRDGVDRETVVAEDRKSDVAKRAETAGGDVEKHVARREPVADFVAVDHQPIERRAGGTALERNLDHVRLAVVASRLFEIHRAQEHLWHNVARHQSARFERLEMATTATARC